MSLSKEQKKKISQDLGAALSSEAEAELKASGGFVWCEPCPYDNRPGCIAFVGDCK